MHGILHFRRCFLMSFQKNKRKLQKKQVLPTFYAMKKTLFFIWSPKLHGCYFFYSNFIILILSGFAKITYELIIGGCTHMDSIDGIFYTCVLCFSSPASSSAITSSSSETVSLRVLLSPSLSSYKWDHIWSQPSRCAPLDFLINCNKHLDITSCVQSMLSTIYLENFAFFQGRGSQCFSSLSHFFSRLRGVCFCCLSWSTGPAASI